jgi:hypothetical protein
MYSDVKQTVDKHAPVKQRKPCQNPAPFINKVLRKAVYSLFGDSENRGTNYLKIRDLLSIALFNILGTHYVIHI